MSAYYDDYGDRDKPPSITLQQARIPMYTTIFQYTVAILIFIVLALLLVFAFKYVLITLVSIIIIGFSGFCSYLLISMIKDLIFG